MWKDYAEHVTESVGKGSAVIVQGRLRQRSYETREGEKRTSYEIDVDEVGVSLRRATVKIIKAERQPTSAAAVQQWEQPASSAPSIDSDPAKVPF